MAGSRLVAPDRRVFALSHTLRVGAFCALVVVAAVAAATPAWSAPRLHVLTTGLNNPRKIYLGAGGTVYVVEAGSGASTRDHRCPVTCAGLTGAVIELADGLKVRVLHGLGSFAVPGGVESEGPADVIVHGNTYDVLMQDMNVNAQGQNTVGVADAGDLFSTPGGAAQPTLIADLGAYEGRYNPDHGAGAGAKFGDPLIDSDPYGFVAYRGGWAVVDASADDLLWVSPSGKVSLLAVFPTQRETLTKQLDSELGFPSNLTSIAVRSVPTCVAVGPDGALYVGELTGRPYGIGTARIWRVVPGKKPEIYDTGFTNVIDIAFDHKDLLVLEIAEKGLLDSSSPGALIKLAPDRKKTLLESTGLVDPTGLAVGNGLIYISNYGVYSSLGRAPHGEVVTIPASVG
jgi:hypothetical protein